MAGRPSSENGTAGKATVITEVEFKKILRFIATGKHPERNKALMMVSHFLGLRAKEMAALKIADIYEGEQLKPVIRLYGSYTKNAKHRDAQLSNPKLMEALTEYIEFRKGQTCPRFDSDAPLFISQNRTAFSPNSMVQVLKNIYVDAGYPDASSHSGRRSLITKLASKSIDINIIRQVAGHASIATTQIYIDDNPGRVADVLADL